MPVPSSISDLSATAASNSPAGSDSIGGNLDDYLRAIQAIIRSESLNKSWQAPGHTATWLSGTQFTVPNDLTATYRVGRRIKATLGGGATAYSTIAASSFAAGVTTVTVENDSTGLSSPISAIELGPDTLALIEASSRIASRAWATMLTPPGAVQAFARSTAPDGWLKAGGQAVSRTTYAALFAAIGTTFGVGDGSTTFNVPDLRGEFVRGWDDSRGIDSGRAYGSAQTDAFQGHEHSYKDMTGGGSFGSISGSGYGSTRATSSIVSDGSSGAPRTASETRPRNIALLYCIKT